MLFEGPLTIGFSGRFLLLPFWWVNLTPQPPPLPVTVAAALMQPSMTMTMTLAMPNAADDADGAVF